MFRYIFELTSSFFKLYVTSGPFLRSKSLVFWIKYHYIHLFTIMFQTIVEKNKGLRLQPVADVCASRIVGGYLASIESVPYQVSPDCLKATNPNITSPIPS